MGVGRLACSSGTVTPARCKYELARGLPSNLLTSSLLRIYFVLAGKAGLRAKGAPNRHVPDDSRQR